MNYHELIATVSQVHQAAQRSAVGAVNHYLILRNWLIGAYLVEFEQRGEDRARYGAGLIQSIARDLKSRELGGLGASMLRDCRTFYRLYPQIYQSAIGELSGGTPIHQSLIGEFAGSAKSPLPPEKSARQPAPLPARMVLCLSWTHLIEFVRLDDPWKRAFYENECLKANWSVRQLQRQIGSLLYDRTALSTDKEAVINHARQQAVEAPQLIADLIRDPYVLEFTGLAESVSPSAKNTTTSTSSPPRKRSSASLNRMPPCGSNSTRTTTLEKPLHEPPGLRNILQGPLAGKGPRVLNRREHKERRGPTTIFGGWSYTRPTILLLSPFSVFSPICENHEADLWIKSSPSCSCSFAVETSSSRTNYYFPASP